MRSGHWAGRAAGVAVSAGLFGLAFPPLRWHVVAWVALVPFFLALRGASARLAVALATAWSLLAAYAVGDWMPRAIETYYEQPAMLGWAFFLGVVVSMAAPYYALFALAARRITRLHGARTWTPLLLAAAWCATELGRGRLLTGSSFFIGNPWALVGYSQVDWPVAVQTASLGGVYWVSFAIAAANAGVVGRAPSSSRATARAAADCGRGGSCRR